MRKKKTKYLSRIRAGVIGLLLLLFMLIGMRWYKHTPVPTTYPSTDYELAEQVERYIQQCGITTEHIGISVYDATAHDYLYTQNPDMYMPPASCIKLLTGITALSRFGIHHELLTSLSYQGQIENHILYGDLYLKADADPLIRDWEWVIQALQDNGIEEVYGHLKLQLQSPRPLEMHDSWGRYDMRKESVPILFRGEKEVRQSLLYALKQAGIKVYSTTPVKAVGNWQHLTLQQHELQEICTPMLLYSDNVLAQCLWTWLNARQNYCGEVLNDFIQKELGLIPIHTKIIDGCGLSPDNQLSARFFTTLMRYTITKPELATYLQEEALPLAGDPERSGTLHWRMNKGSALGKVAAKTGTLNRKGVTSLTGYTETANGHLIIFSIMNQGLNAETGRNFQDNICEILTSKME